MLLLLLLAASSDRRFHSPLTSDPGPATAGNDSHSDQSAPMADHSFAGGTFSHRLVSIQVVVSDRDRITLLPNCCRDKTSTDRMTYYSQYSVASWFTNFHLNRNRSTRWCAIYHCIPCDGCCNLSVIDQHWSLSSAWHWLPTVVELGL